MSEHDAFCNCWQCKNGTSGTASTEVTLSDQDTVTIKRSEYDGLLRDRRELEALDGAGVDNWSGYEYVDWEYVESGVPSND